MLPILYQNHNLILYSYPLLMGLGWGIGYQVYFSLMPSKISHLKALTYFWGIFLAAWIGAKILFYLTYPDPSYGDFIQNISFWTGGGFVFYGGLLGGLTFILSMKVLDKNFSIDIFWPMIPALVLGHGIGRIGCFLAGCCYGKPTDAFWGIYLHDHYRHPTQLIEAFGLIVMGIYFLKTKAPRLNLLIIYLLGYGTLRIIVEALRGDVARGTWGFFTPSQWISLILIFSGLVVLFIKNRVLRKKLFYSS